VVVASKGQAYVVEAITRRLVGTFGCDVQTALEVVVLSALVVRRTLVEAGKTEGGSYDGPSAG